VKGFPRNTAPVLGLLIAVTFVFGLYRHGFFDWDLLKRHHESWGALNSIVTIAALVVGFILSYYRFFAGRTFACRADLTVRGSQAITPAGGKLHGVTVVVKNVGTLPIYDAELRLMVTDLDTSGKRRQKKVEKWTANGPFLPVGSHFVIDPGESDEFYAVHEVGVNVYASHYVATVRDSKHNVWRGYKLIAPGEVRAAEGDPGAT